MDALKRKVAKNILQVEAREMVRSVTYTVISVYSTGEQQEIAKMSLPYQEISKRGGPRAVLDEIKQEYGIEDIKNKVWRNKTMNKNEAKKKILSKLREVDMSATDFVKIVATISTAVDAIKPEKRYRVKVYALDLPAVFYRKRDGGTLSFVQGGAGLPETEFTMGEIKRWHLENCELEEVTDDEQ